MSGRLLDAVPLSSLTGVGAAQSKLAKIGLHTVQICCCTCLYATKIAIPSTR